MDVLAEIFATRPRDHWVAAIQAAGLPAGPVRTISDALESPEVTAAGLIQTLTHATAGDIRLLRSPINLATTAPREDTPPPTLGQHTDVVLSDLIGFSDDELVRLREAGTIA